MITRERLKELLDYDPETGVFTWKVSRGRLAKHGDAAGCLSPTGYSLIRVDRVLYRAHRLTFLYMEGALPPEEVDHLNHIKNDNRWCNVRHATRTENNRNTSKQSNNTSGALGVGWFKKPGKWRAQITVNRKAVHLGLFDSLEEAIAARAAADIEYGFHENHGQEKVGTDD